MTTMDDAWAKFDEAVEWEEKASKPMKDGRPKPDNVKAMAIKKADKTLDEAIRLEAEALGVDPPAALAA